MIRRPQSVSADHEASRLRELSAQCLELAETSNCADVRTVLLEMALEHERTLKAMLEERLLQSPDLVRLPREQLGPVPVG